MFGKRHIPGKKLAILWLNSAATKIEIRKLAKVADSAGRKRFRELAQTINRLIPPRPLRSEPNQ
jgi:hypothetical protein